MKSFVNMLQRTDPRLMAVKRESTQSDETEYNLDHVNTSIIFTLSYLCAIGGIIK